MNNNKNVQYGDFTSWMKTEKPKPKKNYIIVWEIAKAIVFFPIGIAFAWIVVWGVNIVEWGLSLTIGSFIKTLFLCSPHYSVFHFVCDAISMFPYLLVYASGFLLLYTRPWYLTRLWCVLYGLCMIAIFDPSAKNYLPRSMYDFITTLQKEYHYRFIGGTNFWNADFSEKVTAIQYGLFDAFIIIIALLIIFNKDREEFHFSD